MIDMQATNLLIEYAHWGDKSVHHNVINKALLAMPPIKDPSEQTSTEQFYRAPKPPVSKLNKIINQSDPNFL